MISLSLLRFYNQNMSNKKQQTKKEPSVLLGIPDGDIEVDNDAYITKLGGLPVSNTTLLFELRLTCLLK